MCGYSEYVIYIDILAAVIRFIYIYICNTVIIRRW